MNWFKGILAVVFAVAAVGFAFEQEWAKSLLSLACSSLHLEVLALRMEKKL